MIRKLRRGYCVYGEFSTAISFISWLAPVQGGCQVREGNRTKQQKNSGKDFVRIKFIQFILCLISYYVSLSPIIFTTIFYPTNSTSPDFPTSMQYWVEKPLIPKFSSKVKRWEQFPFKIMSLNEPRTPIPPSPRCKKMHERSFGLEQQAFLQENPDKAVFVLGGRRRRTCFREPAPITCIPKHLPSEK